MTAKNVSDMTKYNEGGQDRTGRDGTGQDRTGQDRTGHGRTGQDSRHDKTGQGKLFQTL